MNWNYAASQASAGSRYLKFVHADDTISPRCLEHMVDVAARHPTVGMVGSPRRAGDGFVDLDGIPPTAEIVPGRWLVRRQLADVPYVTGPPTATLLRTTRSARGPALQRDVRACRRRFVIPDPARVRVRLCRRALDVYPPARWIGHVIVGCPGGNLGGRASPHGARARPDGRPDAGAGAPVLGRWERRYELMLVKWTLSLKLVHDREVRAYHRTALARLERAALAAGHVLPPALRVYAAVLAQDEAEPVTARPLPDDVGEPPPEPVTLRHSVPEGVARHR